MRPTLRCVFLFAGAVPVSLVAVLVESRLWTLWLGYLGAIALCTGLDAVLSLPRRRLTVRTTAPELLYIGDCDPLEVELQTRRWQRTARLELLADVDEGLAPQPAQQVEIPPEGRAVAEIALRPRRRGLVEVERLWLRWVGPFGLLRRQVRVPVGRKVSVSPNVRAVRAAALRFFSNRDFLAGLKIEHYIGDGSEFESLREYTPGLDHRAIDWKASARHIKLLTREFRAERNHQVVIAVDTGQLMSEPMGGIPKLDHAINAGLLLGYFSLRSGDRVGMYGFDESPRAFVEPAGGMQSFPRLQKMSADFAYHHAETNFTLGLAELSARLKRRSLVILLTDFVDTITAKLMVDNVHRLSRRHLVVFVTLRDPSLSERVAAEPRTLSDLHEAVVAADFVRERDGVIQRLRHMGVQCIDAPPNKVSIDLVNRYLDIKRREMI